MAASRRCPFRNCGKWIETDKFACGPHWHTLTAEQQSKVWTAYAQWKQGLINGEQLRKSQEEVLGEADHGSPDNGTPCRSCGNPIIWRNTIGTGALMPIDKDPHPTGTIVFVGSDRCEVLTALEAAVRRTEGDLTYISHFATCPHAGKHRKTKKKQ